MRDIIDKKQKLLNYATKLKTIIYRVETLKNRELSDKLIQEKDKLLERSNFLDNYLKAYRKERRR